MKRTWQVWLAFALSFALAAGATAWLSSRILELEGVQEEAQRHAILEESVRLALWRLESALVPILTRENARPHFVYEAFYTAAWIGAPTSKGREPLAARLPSPLLTEEAEHVLLHFQVDSSGAISSPQIPREEDRQVAAAILGATANLDERSKQLVTLREILRDRRLFDEVPMVDARLLASGGYAAQAQMAARGEVFEGFEAEDILSPLQQVDWQSTFQQADQQSAEPQVDQQPAPERGRQTESHRQMPSEGQAPSREPAPHEQGTSRGQVSQKERSEQQRSPQQIQAQEAQEQPPERRPLRQGLPPPTQQEQKPLEQQQREFPQSLQPSPQAPPPTRQIAQGQQAWSSKMRQTLLSEQEWENRWASNTAIAQQISQTKMPAVQEGMREGLLRPLWIGDELILVRRAVLEDPEAAVIQGCWIDWPGLKASLLERIGDLLPAADLVKADVPAVSAGSADSTRSAGPAGSTGPAGATIPVVASVPRPGVGDPSRLLATLPIRVVPGAIAEDPGPNGSPLKLSLLVAWGCLAMAAVAVAVLLLGALSLSERRAAFVSAVTHELRTPLTTFRMYTEMLTAGMVLDEEKRKRYVETLGREASRLSHLVENVLAYARLEKGRRPDRIEPVTLDGLFSRALPRLEERAAQAGLTVTLVYGGAEGSPIDPSDRVLADPSAVEQILFNLVDNACKYATSATKKEIHVSVGSARRSVAIRVRDHGPGVSNEMRRRLFRPFSKSAQDAARTAPGVGLGLALSRRLAHQMGGELLLESSVSEGACFVLSLRCAPYTKEHTPPAEETVDHS